MTTTSRLFRWVALLALIGAEFLRGWTMAVPIAWAATITVTTTADELTTNGQCSLREAISNANADAATYADCAAGTGADQISMPVGTYVLTQLGANENSNATGDFDINDTDGLTLMGAGQATTILDGSGTDRVLEVATGPFTLTQMTVRNAVVTGNGGGAAFTTLTQVSNVTFFNNASTGDGGGATFNLNAFVTSTSFISNSSGASWGGGARFFSTVSLTGSAFLSNTANSGGGGYFGAVANITNTTFVANVATANGGGALFSNANTRQLVNVLFARNSATTNGAAIIVNNTNPMHLIHVTVVSPTLVSNQGIYINAGTVFITNTIVASYTTGIHNASGTVTQNYNLFFGNTSNTGGTVGGGTGTVSGTVSGNPQFINPNNNYHLNATSPAVDAGTNADIGFDIDGDSRGANADIGYDEAQPLLPCLATPDDGTTVFNSADAAAVQDAVNAAAADGSVKIAGICVGVQASGGTTQTMLITRTLTLAGGYTATDWTQSNPLANVTVLDAQGGGRVLSITAPITLMALQLQNGRTLADGQDGAGIYTTQPITLNGVTVYSNSVNSNGSGAGGYFASSAMIFASAFISNAIPGGGLGGGLQVAGVAHISGTLFERNTNSFGSGGGANFDSAAFFTASTFISNSAPNNSGGGALFNSDGSLNNLTFTNNVGGLGGGARIAGLASITGSTFISNTAVGNNGGALHLGSDSFLTNTLLIANRAQENGGGIYRAGGGLAILANVLLARNSANLRGAALYNDGASATTHVLHTTIVSPTLVNQSALEVNLGTLVVTNTVIVSHSVGISNAASATQNYNLFFGNTSNTQGTVGGGTGTVTGNPRFVNQNADDYHLGVGSPAIDAGTNAGLLFDIDSDARPQGASADMGYDETPGDIPITGLSAQNNSPTLLGAATSFTASLSAGTNVTYAWNFGDQSPISNLQSPTHTYASVGSYLAIVTATNSVGSVSTSTLVTITDVPLAGLSASNNSPTVLGNVTAFSASLSAGTNVTYEWNFGDQSPISNLQSPTHTYASVGNYLAIVTATNGAGSVSASTLVTITDVPIAGLSASNDSPNVVGTPTTFNASLSTGTNVTYEWNFGDQSPISNLQSPTHTYASPGIYTAFVTATNSLGSLSASTWVTIAEAEVPISGLVAYNGSPTILGNPTLFDATINEGTNVTYTWDFGDQSPLSNLQSPAHVYTALGAYLATVTATNSLNTVTATTMVTITDVPVSGLSAQNSSPTLLGAGTFFTASLSAGTNVTYQWNFGDQSPISSLQSPTHTYSAPGTFTAIVTATNTAGSVNAVTQVVIEAPATPIAGLSANSDSPTQLGNQTTFNAVITAGTDVAYQWNFGDGNSDVGATVAHTYDTVGTFTALVTATNNAGSISASTLVTITDVATTELSAASSSPNMLTLPTFFTASHSAGSNVTYAWNFGDQSPISSLQSPTHTYMSVGTYTAIVTATNSVGSLSATTLVTVTALEIPITGLSAASSSPTIHGNATAFTATLNTGNNVAYQWQFGDGASAAGASAAHTYSAVGVYTATVSASNQLGSASASTLITVTDRAITGLSVQNNSPQWLGSPVVFTTSLSTGTNVSYIWRFGDGTFGTGTGAEHTYTTFGAYTIVVTATNSVGSVSASTMATVTERPIVGLSVQAPALVAVGTAYPFTTSLQSGIASSYRWEFGDGGIVVSTQPTTTYTYRAAGTFPLTVTVVQASNAITLTATRSVVATQAIGGLSAQASTPSRFGQPTFFTATVLAGNNITYTWNRGNGTPLVTGSTFNYIYPTTGTYTVVVTATNTLNLLTDTVVVQVAANQPPVADAGLNQTVLRNTAGVVLNGTRSSDPDGEALQYRWQQIGGITVTLANPNAITTTFTSPNSNTVLSFTLRITDTAGASTQDMVTITVTNSNQNITGLNVTAATPIQASVATLFTATVSNGTNISYTWDFGDGGSAVGPLPTHAYGLAGVYTAVVTATNTQNTRVATTTVTVLEVAISGLQVGNSSPTQRGQYTTLMAQTNTGTNVVYTWNLGNGTILVGNPVMYRYPSAGNYTVIITATNSLNTQTASTPVAVFVAATGPNAVTLTNNSVDEKKPVGTVVGLLGVVNPFSETHTYALVAGGVDNAAFTIVGNELRTAAVFTQTLKSSYAIRVRAVNALNQSAESAFTINVMNVNDAPTALSLNNALIDESRPPLTTIGVFTATDSDPVDLHTFTLVPGAGSADNGVFIVAGGVLKSAQPFTFSVRSTYNIRVRATDVGGLWVERPFTVTIRSVNDAPTNILLSNNVISERLPINTVVGTLTAADSDNTVGFTYVLTNGPGMFDNALFNIMGTQLRTSAMFTYVQRSLYTLWVQVTDQGGLAFGKALTITVTPNPGPPITTNDKFFAHSGRSEVFDVLANDRDWQGTRLTLVSVSEPNDTDTAIQDNKLYFKSDGDVSQGTPYNVTYVVSNSYGLTATGTANVIVVTLQAIDVFDANMVDARTTTSNMTVTANLYLSHGTAPSEVRLKEVGSAAYGQVAIVQKDTSPYDIIVYTPTVPITQTVVDYVYYRAQSKANADLQDQDDIAITISPARLAPTAVTDVVQIQGTAPVTLNVLANDITPPARPANIIQSVGGNPQGSVSISADQRSIVYTPRLNFFGVDAFTYLIVPITDAAGLASQATVSVTVPGTRRPPTALPDTFTVDRDTIVTLTVKSNDVPFTTTDVLTITGVGLPQNGLTQMLPDGRIRYQPFAQFSGVDTFLYTLQDQTGREASALVTVTVQNVATAPNGVPVAAFTAPGTPTVIDVGNDAYNPSGQAMIVASYGPPALGQLLWLGGTRFLYTPTVGFSGEVNFTYTLRLKLPCETLLMERMMCSEEELRVPANAPGQPGKGAVVIGGGPGAGGLSAPPQTASGQGGLPFSLNPFGGATGASGQNLALIGLQRRQGLLNTQADGSVEYTPPYGFVGVDYITYTVSDGEGGFATNVITITVEPRPLPPLARVDTPTMTADSVITISVLANDQTYILGGTMTVTEITSPTRGQALINLDNTVTYTPEPYFGGVDYLAYTVVNTDGLESKAFVIISVQRVNYVPTAYPDFAVADVNGHVNIPVLRNDWDWNSDPLSVVSAQPQTGTVRITPVHALFYEPPADFVGVVPITYTISDGDGGFATSVATVTVGYLTPRLFTTADTFEVVAGEDTMLDVLANDFTESGQPLTLLTYTAPAQGAVLLVNNQLFYSSTLRGLTENFTYTVSDGVNTRTVSVTVTVVAPLNYLYLPFVRR